MKRWQIWLEFTGLGGLIMGPLLLPGYILALDMPWGPRLPVPEITSHSWLLVSAMHVLGAVVGSMWVQKLVLLGIFVLAGVGAYRLAAAHVRAGSAAPAYLAGLIYVFNPFVYTRFVEGQYLVILGYALLPWTALTLWKLFTVPSWPAAWRAALAVAAVGVVSLHTAGFAMLLGMVLLVAALAGRRLRQSWARARWWLAAGAVWLGSTLLWLAPFVAGRTPESRSIASFSTEQFGSFATRSDVHSVPVTALLLQGFWNDHSGTYILPSDLGWWWFAAAAGLMGLVVLGAVASWLRRDRLGLGLLVAGLVAWWLAMGVAWSASAPLTHWLVEHVPLYRGYREPGKWLALLALAYAYLGAAGLAWLLGWVEERRRGLVQVVAGAALVLPVLFAPVLLFGAARQLHATDYPADWYALDARFTAEPGTFKVLMLPWHQYLPLEFVGRTVAGPGNNFFGRPLITADNAELPGLPGGTRPDTAAVQDQVLDPARRGTTAGAALAPLGVRYVVLLKEADWSQYQWLDEQTDLRLESSGATLRVYRNTAEGAP